MPFCTTQKAVVGGQEYIRVALLGAGQMQRVKWGEAKPFESHGALGDRLVWNYNLFCQSK